ncbi:MAG: SUMF1/EgtB/PvdO family nonheme iron enzyme [Bacteroidetes bacterium]|nr:SUMF1/EgtB/PvdO family nonheme iron enzyme [Bacteroidota bacterium]
MRKLTGFCIIALLIATGLTSCKKNTSSSTGWEYNSKENGGFEKLDYNGQETGPGLVFVEGGTFIMGQKEQDVMFDYNAIQRRITVSSFYMDETEVANIHYREYLYWLERVYGESYPEVLRKALPDTLVWRDELAYNEPYVEYYFRHPAYDMYPVVGINWLQANDFCAWRTDRVNEKLLIDHGILNENPNQVNEDNFNTEAYLLSKYEGDVRKNLPDLNPNGSGERPVRFEDGILLPDYRLPTEAEWEFAANGLVGNQPYVDEERFTDNKIYPWNGTSLRYPRYGKRQGTFLANFKRGRGDMMGMAGKLNDDGSITAQVDAYFPNDYGLFNMAGNVNEWVGDVYRPMSSIDENDFNSFRGNIFKTKMTDNEGNFVDKDSLGRIQFRNVTDEEAAMRRNYRKSDVRNNDDGDVNSWTQYNYGISSLINDNARVFKGGGWKDRAYWLSPGVRRYLQETDAMDYLGFRCAMDRVGSPRGNEFDSGNSFGMKKRR